MNLRSPSVIFSIPFFIFIIIALQIGGDGGYWSAILMVTGMVGAGLILVFRQQIHWYWYSQNPPPVEEALIDILQRRMPYFRGLSPENKALFLRRLSLFLMAKEIESLSEDLVPADFKGLIAAAGVQLAFGRELFLYPNFKKIIVYPSYFRSVENKELHASETFIDGDYKGHSCLIFAADAMLKAFPDDARHFNTAVYEMATVFKVEYLPSLPNLSNDAVLLPRLAWVRGISYSELLTYLGKPSLDLFALSVEHFFAQPQRFQQALPELFEVLCGVLNQNPLNGENPILSPVNYEKLEERRKIF